MKNRAFTLVEVVLTMMVIGVLAAIAFSNLRNEDFDEKTFVAQARKTADIVGQATIRLMEGGDLFSPDNVTEAYNSYKNFIKFSNPAPITDLTKCSGYDIRTAAGVPTGSDAEAPKLYCAKLPSGVYIIFHHTGDISCPDYYFPGDSTLRKVETGLNKSPQKTRCWGKLYVDTNGPKLPNQLQKDVWIWGLNGSGVAI